jgi:hypothetical protein
MKLFESADFIAIKTTHSYSIITITYKPYDHLFPPGLPPANGQQMGTYKNAKNDKNKSISQDNKPHPDQNRIGSKFPFKEKYQFNPREGTYSALELTKVEMSYLPKIRQEYDRKLAEYMKRAGIENRYEVDPFKFSTFTDFKKATLDDIRKGRPPEWLK